MGTTKLATAAVLVAAGLFLTPGAAAMIAAPDTGPQIHVPDVGHEDVPDLPDGLQVDGPAVTTGPGDGEDVGTDGATRGGLAAYVGWICEDARDRGDDLFGGFVVFLLQC